MSGLRFEETMAGTYRAATADTEAGGGEPRAFSFTVRAHVPRLVQHLFDHLANLEGHVDAEGLATRAPLTGTLLINPVLGRTIAYEFSFTGDDGQTYRFAGRKHVTPLRPVESMTHMEGELTDERGVLVATAQVSFKLRDLPGFLRSMRPTF